MPKHANKKKEGKLLLSFAQGGKITDSKGKRVKASEVQKKAVAATKKKCPPSKPVAVIRHTSSGVPVISHCRGGRGTKGPTTVKMTSAKKAPAPKGTHRMPDGTLHTGEKHTAKSKPISLAKAKAQAKAKAPAKKAPAKKAVGVGATKGKLSDAVLKGIGKAPAKKAPAKRAPAKKAPAAAPAKAAPAKKGLSAARARTQAYKDEVAKLRQEYPDAKVSKLGKGLTMIGLSRDSFEFSSDKAGVGGHRFIDRDDVRKYMEGGAQDVVPAEPAEPKKNVIRVKRARAPRVGETKGKLSDDVLRGIGRAPAKKKIKVKGTRALRVGETKGELSPRIAGSLARAREAKLRSSNPSLAYA